jgi:glycosyltransferase involved in cell wall biosynthesis
LDRRLVVLYTHPKPSSFVRKDLAIFKSDFDVLEFQFVPRHKVLLPWVFVLQGFYILLNARRVDIFITQFAGYASFLPVFFAKLLGKPCLIITGGTDCVAFPNIKYGNFSKPVLGWFTAQSLRHATALSSVHESLQFQAYGYDADSPRAQGYITWACADSSKDRVIYNGYESGVFRLLDSVERKPQSFVTVLANPQSRFARNLKGLDVFIELAILKPHAQFTVVGGPQGFELEGAPKNVSFKPFASPDELCLEMNAHQFYVQLSLSEGFPNALCEAMLCGCVPIVSHVAAMPFIVEDLGVIVAKRGAEYVMEALVDFGPLPRPELVRERIIQRFPLEKRTAELRQLVKDLCAS